MFGKPLEYWVAFLTAILIVFDRHREKGLLSGMLYAAISGGIGYSMAPDLAAWMGRSEILAVMILTAFGYALIDVGMALISDRQRLVEDIRNIILRRMGGK